MTKPTRSGHSIYLEGGGNYDVVARRQLKTGENLPRKEIEIGPSVGG